MIGTLLDLPTETLNTIEHDKRDKAECCCIAMLEKWLQVDTTASWGKLFTVIESSAVSGTVDKGDYNYVLSMLSLITTTETTTETTPLTTKFNQLTVTDRGKLYMLQL